MSDSIHLALPYIAAAQAQKHVTHNEALRILDTLVMLAVKDRDLSAPPGSPAEGERYLVKPTGSGGFAGRNNQLAHYRDGGWVFHAPQAGWLCYVEDEDALIVFDGTAWTSSLQNVSRLGVGATADDTNRFSARLNNALWSALYDGDGGDGSLRIKLNKEAAGDVLSLLFQTAYSGRAEFGLIGDDNLTLKVSADGTAWTTAVTVDKTTGRLSIAADPIAGLGVATRRYADSYSVLRDLGAPRALLPGMTPAASRSSMGATLSGAAKWIGGVLGPDGNIYGMPFNGTDILIINPVAGTAARSAMGATLTGTGKWLGGVMGPDGKLYGIPADSTDILIIDAPAGTASRSAMGATLTGSGKWRGGVLGPDGKIYGIPYDSTDILIVDPVAGTASRSAMGATLTGSAKWIGGVLAPNGKIYGIPCNSTDILIIDPVAGTATRSAMGATLTGSGKWFGGALGADGKVYGIPLDSADILIVDPLAGTATRSAMGATLSGSGKWGGGALGPDGKVYGIPFNSIDILIIDPVAGTATRSALGATLTGSVKWGSGTLGPDSRIYGIPYDSTDVLALGAFLANFRSELLRSPYLNGL